MTPSSEERIQEGLSQLLENILPTYPDEDEAAADERYEEAYTYVTDAIGSAGEPAVAADINHVSDLIKKKLIKDYQAPDRALRFSNLYSKFVASPVLSQKWAILWFLYQLADPNDPSIETQIRPSRSERLLSYRDAMEIEPQTRTPTPKRPPGRQFVVDSPAFNEAFSNAGLARLPVAEDSRTGPRGTREPRTEPLRTDPRATRPPRAERPERLREKVTDETDQDDPTVRQAFTVPRRTTIDPSEPALLRDLPFTLQGLSSTNLQFTTNTTLKLPPTLPVPFISLLHELAEPSLLYKNLSEFVETTEGGLVGQSFRSALALELRSYLSLVATLEGQIRRALAMLDDSQPRQGIGKAGVTLRRCVIWTREATMGLRLMGKMVEDSRGKRGGELISLIHSFSTSHGDPFVIAFADRLLKHVARPFNDMLRSWIYDGELSDPYKEFFVTAPQDDGNALATGSTNAWEDKYQLDVSMIPTIMTFEFATKVFLIGKSLNFIRTDCKDPAWVESYSKSASRDLRYGDTATVERNIGEAYKTTMAHLTHLMADKFRFFDHIKALKRYILLGAGDFVAVLMESLITIVERPASVQYRHSLSAQLEHAFRSSNAQYDDPKILRRLDSRMLELSHGEVGWDVFTLEYKVDPPVDVIVTPQGNRQYLKVFNFLWRVKRIEFVLNVCWRRCMTGARGVLGSVEDKLGQDWKKVRAVVAEMIHFVNQLQHYILFEVIESSWNELQAAMTKPESTLDDLIHAHEKYLMNITRKGLLGSSVYNFTSQLHELLKTILAYKDAVDGLYSFSVAEFTRRQEASARIESRTAAGKWGITERDGAGVDGDSISTPTPTPGSAATRGPAKRRLGRSERDTESPFAPPGLLSSSAAAEDHMLPSLRARLADLAKDFRVRVNCLLGDLMHQPDADMRWLAMVMNFNDAYQPVRRKKRGVAAAKGKEKERGGEREARGEETPQAQAQGGAEMAG